MAIFVNKTDDAVLSGDEAMKLMDDNAAFAERKAEQKILGVMVCVF